MSDRYDGYVFVPPRLTADVMVFRQGDKAIAVDRYGRPIIASDDHAEVIQKAIDEVASKGGGKVYITGYYNINKTIGADI